MTTLTLTAGVVGGRSVVVERHDGAPALVVVDDVRFERDGGRVVGIVDDQHEIRTWSSSAADDPSSGSATGVEVLSMSWATTSLGWWTALLAPGLEPITVGRTAIELAAVTLRVREVAGSVRGLALTWHAADQGGVRLAGTTITHASDGVVALTVELGDWGRGTGEDRGRLVTDAAVSAVRVESPLNWLEHGLRRLVPDIEPTVDALITGTVAAVPDGGVLVEFDPAGAAAPAFLPATRIEPTGSDAALRPLPLLRSPTHAQTLQWGGRPGDFDVELRTDGLVLALSCDADLGRAGDGGAGTDGSASHQALAVDHGRGLPLYAADGSSTVTFRFAGFDWRVEAPAESPPLVLTTADGDTTITLGPSAVATLAYDGIGDEPVRFAVERLVVTDGGLDADATVLDEPVTLHGIATAFRFDEGRVEVRGGALQDFSLLGTGPLPPDLVGEASAAVAIQFAAVGDEATPVGAGATLTATGTMRGTAVPFAFDLSAIGLGYEAIDGTYHFFFTLTGEAAFAPDPGFPADHPLAALDVARIGLDAAPLAGDVSALLSRMSFSIELATPASFEFLGCFTMEVEEVALYGQTHVFDGAPGIELAGRIRFADGEGDKKRSAESRHRLVIGPPAAGEWVPRIHVAELGVTIQKGDAFTLDASVSFVDTADEQGFTGEGTIEIQGLPSLAVAVGFMRVRRPAEGSHPEQWHRAWFIAVNVGRLTLRIPYVNIFIREVGLGFGYRYTLTSIAAADETASLGELLAALREASRTQGDLATVAAWQVSLEPRGADPRWTIALRALFTQNASPLSTPIRLHEQSERGLANAFLFDVLAAVRSDLTILMTARLWLNTNYLDYVGDDSISGRPLFSGFALVQPAHQRFLAQVSSNPDGHMGSRPPLPSFLETALASSQVAATVLVEPNLVHAELGWPNGLRSSMRVAGVVDVDIEAGAIYRIASLGAGAHHLVIGLSLRARASMSFRESIDLGIAGASIVARASASFGARFIAAAQLGSGSGSDALDMYGGVSVDIRVAVEIRAWIGLDLGFFGEIKKHFHFALELGFSASLEFGFRAAASGTRMGFQGRGTLLVRVCGRSFEFDVAVAHDSGTVRTARLATARYMSIGLEAGDGPASLDQPQDPARPHRRAATPGRDATPVGPTGTTAPRPSLAAGRPSDVALGPPDTGEGARPVPLVTERGSEADDADDADDAVEPAAPAVPAAMMALLVRAEAAEAADAAETTAAVPPADLADVEGADGHTYVVLYPGDGPGFLPNHPPLVDEAASDASPFVATTDEGAPLVDFRLDLGVVVPGLQRWDPASDGWVDVTTRDVEWRGDWSAELATMIDAAFVRGGDPPHLDLDEVEVVADGRVTEPSDADYEAAVRGTVDEFRRSPMFRPDPGVDYEQRLRAAFSPDTDVYERPEHRRARQLRGVLVQQVIGDLQDWLDDQDAFTAERALGATGSSRLATSPLFRLGLVFRLPVGAADGAHGGSGWPGDGDGAEPPRFGQRVGTAVGLEPATPVTLFNPTGTDFTSNPPVFEEVQEFTDSSMVAFGWRLRWDAPAGVTGPAAEVEHHLAHYEVRRRTLLDGQDTVVVTTVKPADTLAYGGDAVDLLRRRFELVDSFDEEGTGAAPLPSAGRTYVYTVTPVDVTGGRGRPLTLVATRRPTTPPLVPTDATLAVRYVVGEHVRTDAVGGSGERGTFDRAPAGEVVGPVEPARVALRWTPPSPQAGRPVVAIEEHQLVLRRREALPVGSYGLDTATNGAERRDLPSSAARVRADDVVVPLSPVVEPDGRWSAEVDAERLRAAGVLPRTEWRPEAWQVFVRTVSEAGVPSALVRVELRLEFVDGDGVTIAERQPAELEWLAPPMDLPVLRREDCMATAGRLHLPTPTSVDAAIAGAAPIAFDPTDERIVRVQWNQAPTTDGAYPTGLTAGFHVFRIDIDATTADVLATADGVRRHAVLLDDVRLQDPATAALEPRDTATPALWRVRHGAPPDVQDPAIVWPTVGADVDGLLHPALRRIVELLEEPDGGVGSDLPDLVVGVERGRPVEGRTWAAVEQAFAPGVDPVGWGLLGFLGLGVTISARDRLTNEPLDGAALRARVAVAVAELAAGGGDVARAIDEHLVVTSLYQPQAARRVAPGGDDPTALLGALHLSLRPRLVELADRTDGDAFGRAALQELVDRVVPVDAAVAVPAAADLPPAWFRRFLDHAPGGESGTIAAAVPRQSAPRRAIPDPAGRVHLDDHIADGYAHAFRYLVRPYSRYDRLWHGVAEATSPIAAAALGGVDRPLRLDGGVVGVGADAAVDRVAPLVPPTIVSSTRVDAAADGTAPPGAVWEVVIATHPEQVLSEQNRTVARRLDHRQVVHTITRSFVHDPAARAVGWTVVPPPGATDTRPAPLPVVPAVLDHVDLSAVVPGSELAAQLSVVDRIGDPARQATIVHVAGVPFYYEHTLHAVAQASHVVSPVASVVQRDFGYRTPAPVATIAVEQLETTVAAPDEPDDAAEEGVVSEEARRDEVDTDRDVTGPEQDAPDTEHDDGDVADEDPGGVDTVGVATSSSRVVTVALACLWDSLTDDARRRWPDEEPPRGGSDDDAGSGGRESGDGALVHGAVPDPGVAYDLLYARSGTVQPIAVLQFEPARDGTSAGWHVRPVGDLFRIARRPGLVRPPGADRRSSLGVSIELEYVGPPPDETTASEGDAGVPSRAAVPIPRVPDGLPPGVVAGVTHGHLVGFAPVVALTDAQRAAVLPTVRDAHARLVAQSTGRADGTPVSTPLAIPDLLPGMDGLTWELDEDADAVTALTWSGAMTSSRRSAATEAVRGTGLQAAVGQLLDLVADPRDTRPGRLAPSLRDLLPPSLVVEDTVISWTPPVVVPPDEPGAVSDDTERGDDDTTSTDEDGPPAAEEGPPDAASGAGRETTAVDVADELRRVMHELEQGEWPRRHHVDAMRELLARLDAMLRDEAPGPDERRELSLGADEVDLLVPRLVPHALESYVRLGDDPWTQWVEVRAGDVIDELVDALRSFGDPELREAIAELLSSPVRVEVEPPVPLLPSAATFHTHDWLVTERPVPTASWEELRRGLPEGDHRRLSLDALYDQAMALGLGGGVLHVRSRRGAARPVGPVPVVAGGLATTRADGVVE